MSSQCLGEGSPVRAQQHDGPEPRGSGAHQVVDVGSLQQPTGDPHDRVVRGEARGSRMGVGRLAVVDPDDARDGGHEGIAVRVGDEALQPVAYGLRGNAVGPGERTRSQGVRHVVGPGDAEVGQGGELGGLAGHVRARPVDEQVLDQPQLAGARNAEGEADPGTGPGREPDRLGVLAVVHGDGPGRVDAPLRRRVGVEAPVPVQVVGRHVEHHRGVRPDGGGPVELEARELHREHVVRLLGQDRVEQGQADVAGRDRAPPGGFEDRGEHAHGRRLAVGAGHGQPGRRRTVEVGLQPPGKLDLTDHLDAGRGRRDEQRCIGSPSGRGDDQCRARGRVVGGDHLEVLGPQAGRPLLVAVDDRDPCATGSERTGRRSAADPGPGDRDRQPVVALLPGDRAQSSGPVERYSA